MSPQTHRRELEPAPAQVVPERLAHERAEQTVEMEWRGMRDAGQRLEIEFLVEVAVDVLDHRYAFVVFGLAAAGSGHAGRFSGRGR